MLEVCSQTTLLLNENSTPKTACKWQYCPIGYAALCRAMVGNAHPGTQSQKQDLTGLNSHGVCRVVDW